MTVAPLPSALAAAAVGGVLGSLARYGLSEEFGVTLGFPWATFCINVVGSGLLAALPLLAVVRRTPWLAVFLGTGVLGGFTTMSTASAQTVVLFEHDRAATAFAYAGGTLLAAVGAVMIVSSFTAARDRVALEEAGADE